VEQPPTSRPTPINAVQAAAALMPCLVAGMTRSDVMPSFAFPGTDGVCGARNAGTV
jgi:hypothetical protein